MVFAPFSILRKVIKPIEQYKLSAIADRKSVGP